MIKEDCFAYIPEKRRCKALNDLYCKNGECGFYKTKANFCDKCKESTGKLIDCNDCMELWKKD